MTIGTCFQNYDAFTVKNSLHFAKTLNRPSFGVFGIWIDFLFWTRTLALSKMTNRSGFVFVFLALNKLCRLIETRLGCARVGELPKEMLTIFAGVIWLDLIK